MIVLHAAPISADAVGGMNASVPRLASAQNALDGVTAGLVVTRRDGRQPTDAGFATFGAEEILEGRGRLNLPQPFDAPDVVVFHSTYIPLHAAIARRLRSAGIPYIMCPRGSMNPYALGRKWLKKRIADLVLFRPMVARAAAVHCLTRREAEDVRSWRRPVFVVGNGTDLPDATGLDSLSRFARPRIVFLGRLSIDIKGLDLLLDACRLVRPELERRGVRIELIGPDHRGDARRLAERIARLRLGDVAVMRPPVWGEEKAALLRKANVLVQTSRSEGHPMAVLEALAYGIPCLLTPATNMAEEVTAAGAGWVTAPTPDAIADALVTILQTDAESLRRHGANARALAVARYRWHEVAAQNIAHYRRFAA